LFYDDEFGEITQNKGQTPNSDKFRHAQTKSVRDNISVYLTTVRTQLQDNDIRREKILLPGKEGQSSP